MLKRLKIALCQVEGSFSVDGEDPRPHNVRVALEWIRRAAGQGANIALFGEVYLNGYRSDMFLRDFATVLDPPDENVKEIEECCRENGIYVAMGVCRRGPTFPGNLFNSAVLIGPEGVVGHYDKVHLGNFPLPDGRLATEGMYWNEGHGYHVFRLPWCRVGLQICRDVRYPEASRVLTLMGAELIINLSAAVEVRHSSWEYFTKTRANENQVWFAMTSIVGEQRDFRLFGGSRIVSPTGEVVARAKDDVEDLVIHEIDLEEVHRTRALAHVLDRRAPQAYKVLVEE